MIALGVGTVWAGYYLFIYGYCLVRGYNVTFTDLMHSTWPGGGTKSTPAAKSTGTVPPAASSGGGHVLAN